MGSSKSQSQSSEDQTTQRGSSVQAGGTAGFVSTNGDVTIAGSNVKANDVILAAKNQVNVINTTDTDSTRSSNSSSSASVGVQYTLGGGFGVSAAMANAHGDANSDASIQNASHVTGANSVTVISGGDTNIIGSQISGKHINADVGGNLNIVSVQDITDSAAHQSSTGGGFTISQGGGSASFSAQNGHADSNYAGVNEQAGINAGDGGFNVNVRGNTGLTGGVISSTADESKNSLTAGTLTFNDIQNQSHYDANSNGVSAGVGFGGSTGKSVGPGSVSGHPGVSPMISQNESGDSSATTRSAISAGTINVTNGVGQTQDIANLSRDTTNTNGTVAKTPDVNGILNQQADTMEAAQAAGQTVSQGIGAYADMKREDAAAAYKAASDRGDSAGMAAAAADYNNWKEGGDSRAELHVVGGGLIGGLGGGSALGAIGGAAGAGLASKMAGTLNDISKGVASATGSDLIGNLAATIAAGVGGAVVGGTAGAAMASNVHLYNQSMDDERQLTGDSGRKSPTLFSLAMQGIANGLNAVIGVGGGVPPAASPGVALAESGAANAVPKAPGYLPDNATLASGGNNNRLPIPETVTADNGLQVESNPKHTPGMPGNRPNAGTEPNDSLSLFNSSIQGGEKTRFAIDSDGNINRFYSDGNGAYHWTGSTGDSRAPIDVSTIPISVKRTLGFKGK
uniref:hemagglutinin repeat-containing protein n=1 Tax=Paraburkholderia polaris TaxID=2728848 RepID=UPI002E2F533D|nr:hemagglutinin repeat-containing protein [Paraburkholderia polaris]